ncbi:cell cycle protein MesJ [Vibrio ichthyoenteri ATCC 700023]|uniref:tRNA(Ile)-lysidine synthase n=1 Tax=Vibrio ichthyoenteri ATCC 700023 TaxID=870968 RepID=F9S0P9_9VIBR|nr:tRNA lysidine(34) synthetase TilS [Vibrio ichthyoenteri]EGU42882.1 cell cycle protein MesJ [Vibrio ichthyoenteri ATCC 700023]
MDSLYALLTQSLQSYQPNKIVLAFSGGVDSRLLLALLSRYQQESGAHCIAVHVHHGLSDNADVWASQCQQWCKEVAIECLIERVQLDYDGQSVEACAREARYQALAQHVSQGDILLTGQHSDDQLETFLLALKRGSGPKGLSAMAQAMPWREGVLLRPLLRVRRDEIERVAHELQLQWVEDESNQDTRFDRNFIRHQVAPILKQRWPHIHTSVQRSAELCAEQEALLAELLTEQLHTLLADDGSLSIEGLAEKSDRVRMQLLRMWFAHAKLRMPSRGHLTLIWQQVALAVEDANPNLVLAQVQIRRFAQRLYQVLPTQSVSEWQAPLFIGQAVSLPEQLGTLHLSADVAGEMTFSEQQLAQLSVRFNPEGLTAHPIGRGHSRKLKKLFQEYGVPSWLRRRTPIVMCGDEVAAVVGLFVCKPYIGKGYKLDWRAKAR